MSGHDGSGENLADQVRYLMAELNTAQGEAGVWKKDNDKLLAERDRYRKALVDIANNEDGHAQRKARAALSPEEADDCPECGGRTSTT